jgi:hypothetical protein
MNIREKLVIHNFFSLKEFEWNIRGFNVLTGGMGSGKSIALKLLFFCEQIFHQVIFSEPSLSKELFNIESFFNAVRAKFDKIFPSRNHEIDFCKTKIKYEYIISDEEEQGALSNSQLLPFEQPIIRSFDLCAEWDKKTKQVRWSSSYIESSIPKWQRLFDSPNTPDLLDNIRNRIYGLISSDFSNSFPLAAMFIPSSRAIVAIAESISSRDQFINSFFKLKTFALSFENISNNIVNNILRITKITLNERKEPVFELIDGREISALELSSGQQELLYLLLLINDLKNTEFLFGKSVSLFIEEPSAHLFPKEQKDTIEFLAKYFNLLRAKDKHTPGHRFFISTHSPYVLNTVNNVLEKGRLLKTAEKINNDDKKIAIMDKINELNFPSLALTDVSAYMIENSGVVTSMIHNESDDAYIYSEVIEEITRVITGETDKLCGLNEEIKSLVR